MIKVGDKGWVLSECSIHRIKVLGKARKNFWLLENLSADGWLFTCEESKILPTKAAVSDALNKRIQEQLVNIELSKLIIKQSVKMGEEYGIPNVSERPKLTAEEESTTKRK